MSIETLPQHTPSPFAQQRYDWTSLLPSGTIASMQAWTCTCADSWQSKVRLVECIAFAAAVGYVVFLAACPVLFP